MEKQQSNKTPPNKTPKSELPAVVTDLEKKLHKANQLKTKRNWEKSGIKISKELRDILHGYIMSDGYLRLGTLTIDQSVKQKRFVTWLYNKFELIRTPASIHQVRRVHSQTQVESLSLRFDTRAVLKGFNQMWYKPFVDKNGVRKYKKQLPKNIHCFFNERFISLWYAGDGTKVIGSVGAKFEVTRFTVEERLKLQKLFFTHFAIKTTIISSGTSKKGNPQWALKIGAEDYPIFRDLIMKFDLIPTVFPHKLHKKGSL